MTADLRYPIGVFKKPDQINESHIDAWIGTIQAFPEKIADLISPLTKEEQQWRYRPEGWTIHQVVHHCSDSHINAFVRFKWAMTEENPLIKAYKETLWAELPDTMELPIDAALQLLKGLHYKWAYLLSSFISSDLERTFIHPENKRTISLAENIGLYDWHCRHHTAHIEQAIEGQGKYNR